MYRGYGITAVVPAYNEARHISSAVKTMPEFVDHIIVVDDCSTDGTADAAHAVGESRLLVLHTAQNQGVGGSMVLGYRKALDLGADIVVKMDGDGQMPPEYLPRLLDAIIDGQYDYAKGNRFLAADSLAAMPTVRLLGNIVLTFMNKLASGYWQVFDPQNGYTAITATALRKLDLNAIHKRFFFENDMLTQLNYHAARVKDVAIPARYSDEESDLNPFVITLTFPVLLLKRFVRRVYQKYILRDFSPIALFLILGGLLFAWGVLYGMLLWVRTLRTGLPTPTGTIVLALVPLILGFQLLLQGIVLDIEETPK